MLGQELNSLKQSIQSKSSILHEDMDEKSKSTHSFRAYHHAWRQRKDHSQT